MELVTALDDQTSIYSQVLKLSPNFGESRNRFFLKGREYSEIKNASKLSLLIWQLYLEKIDVSLYSLGNGDMLFMLSKQLWQCSTTEESAKFQLLYLYVFFLLLFSAANLLLTFTHNFIWMSFRSFCNLCSFTTLVIAQITYLLSFLAQTTCRRIELSDSTFLLPGVPYPPLPLRGPMSTYAWHHLTWMWPTVAETECSDKTHFMWPCSIHVDIAEPR